MNFNWNFIFRINLIISYSISFLYVKPSYTHQDIAFVSSHPVIKPLPWRGLSEKHTASCVFDFWRKHVHGRACAQEFHPGPPNLLSVFCGCNEKKKQQFTFLMHQLEPTLNSVFGEVAWFIFLLRVCGSHSTQKSIKNFAFVRVKLLEAIELQKYIESCCAFSSWIISINGWFNIKSNRFNIHCYTT